MILQSISDYFSQLPHSKVDSRPVENIKSCDDDDNDDDDDDEDV